MRSPERLTPGWRRPGVIVSVKSGVSLMAGGWLAPPD
jgi:hypothetical protein